MSDFIRRAIAWTLASMAIAVAASGCVVVPERGYYHDGYYEHHYWEH